MLEFSNVSFSYQQTVNKKTLIRKALEQSISGHDAFTQDAIIKDVTFHIRKGDFVALVGENGAGKSTLSKLCNGLLKPVMGDVSVNGQNTKTTKSSKLAKSVGYLFQNPDRQICQNTVEEELMFGLSFLEEDKQERNVRCEEMLKQFHLNPTQDPFHLSRGERQRVALASILICKPKLLILDEPTTGLDYRECVQIMDIIKKLNQEGTTILMITHDMEIVHDYAKRVLVLNDGILIGNDLCTSIMTNHTLLQQASVLPAQIPALALKLGDDFSGIGTVTDMVERIHYLKQRRA